MTILIADYARWQGSLSLAALRRAGFTGINVKVSHGLGQQSVHLNTANILTQARADEWHLSCFHWLTADASGTAQADYAYRRMAELGLNVTGVAHVVDVESDGLTERIYRDYLLRMWWLLQRSVITYSGKWWANDRMWLKRNAESPWLWSAPGQGYQPSYPGDVSPLWEDAYGGWRELAAMQYRVTPIAGIDVSQSAVRDADLWAQMTGAQMAPWGGLNPALTSWRNGINTRFPNRKRTSDGGYADAMHGSASQHQPDSDASVDAFDQDVNLLGSDNEQGTTDERALIEALKLDFEADRRSHLWIHQREIANEDVRTFAERAYAGANPHDKHVHWESEQRYEKDGSPWKFTHTDALLRRMNGDPEVAFQDEKIKLTATAGKELFDPDREAGTEVEASTVLQLAAIHARRAALSTDTVEATLATLGALVQQLISRDDVDETALAEALVPALAAAVLAGLPEGALTSADVEQAVRNVLLSGAAPSA
jgi:hypothetical protein